LVRITSTILNVFYSSAGCKFKETFELPNLSIKAAFLFSVFDVIFAA
jgi:hypothetical protein